MDIRLEQHNQHYFKNGFTKAANDWKLVLCETFAKKDQAQFLERFIKRMKSRKFIEKIITHPEILQDIPQNKK